MISALLGLQLGALPFGIEPDKAKHFAAGAAIGAGAGTVAYYWHDRNRVAGFGIGLGVASLAGLAKELTDSWAKTGRPEVRDFAWTVIGGAAGAGLVLVVPLP